MLDENQPELAPDTPFYFPLKSGIYEVKPGLFKFPHDFGNPEQDGRVFQLDKSFSHYRQAKLHAREERLEKYYCTHQFTTDHSKIINHFVINKLVHEYPNCFELVINQHSFQLNCKLSQDVLIFDLDYQLLESKSGAELCLNYIDGFDALACQIQEDLSVVKLTSSGEDKAIALHLCLPNHWAAEEKVGQGFVSVHAPVPHMEKMNESASQFIHSILHKGPFVRFAWGLATDERLNHHPSPDNNVESEEWLGRRFTPSNPKLYLRVERQTLHGFAGAQIALFTIRTYLYDIKWMNRHYPAHTQCLKNAIESMSDESLTYKGLGSDAPAIIDWLDSL